MDSDGSVFQFMNPFLTDIYSISGNANTLGARYVQFQDHYGQ